jgi:hypothetical protein
MYQDIKELKQYCRGTSPSADNIKKCRPNIIALKQYVVRNGTIGIDDGRYAAPMRGFLDNNSIDEENPSVLCGDTRKKWRSVFEICTVQGNLHCPVLNGEKGIRAKINIPANVVLGEVLGTQYIQSDYGTAFEDTREWTLRNTYSFCQSVIDPRTDTKIDLVLDVDRSKGKDTRNKFFYINDCRKYVSLLI